MLIGMMQEIDRCNGDNYSVNSANFRDNRESSGNAVSDGRGKDRNIQQFFNKFGG